MLFITKLRRLSAEISGLDLDQIQTEEATKRALIDPFIQLLGYNVNNPQEVVPEQAADFGSKRARKVDYAIKLNGRPIMIVECKHWGVRLNDNHADQLFGYFPTTSARVAILTNGLVYKFFSDLEQVNIMDRAPYLEFDIRTLPQEPFVNAIEAYRKDCFDIHRVKMEAKPLKPGGPLHLHIFDKMKGLFGNPGE